MSLGVGILVRITPRTQGWDDVLASRVLAALSGLSPTILLTLTVSPGRTRDDVAASTLDLIARAHDGNLAIMEDSQDHDCERLWRALDRLEGKAIAEPMSVTSDLSPSPEGYETAPSR